MFKVISAVIIIAAVILVIGYIYRPNATIKKGAQITLGGHGLGVEIADTTGDQIQGLSGREFLGDDRGMLFVFSQPFIPGFWMKDMQFPIDIIWIGEDKKVVSVSEDVQPDTYPTMFNPPSEVSYVLEVNAGWAKTKGISKGDVLTIKP